MEPEIQPTTDKLKSLGTSLCIKFLIFCISYMRKDLVNGKTFKVALFMEALI